MRSENVTDIFGRVVLGLFVVAAILAIVRAALAAPVPVAPAEAIVEAVAARLGGDVRVDVSGIDTSVAPTPGLRALLDPAARVGVRSRWVLLSGSVRLGAAVAVVTVSGPLAHARRALARATAVEAADIEWQSGVWPAVPFTRSLAQDDLVGRVVRRDVAAGEPLTGAVLDVPPLVRVGETVSLHARVGSVQVVGEAVAASSGHRGDVIRVTPRPNGRPVRARVTGAATAEVVP